MHIEAGGHGNERFSSTFSRRIDDLLDESETAALMRLSEESISDL
jgi:hypothetical protein